jgi:adenylate cyclase
MNPHADLPEEGKEKNWGFLKRIINNRFSVPLLLFLLIQGMVMLGVFSRLEMTLYDSWFRLAGEKSPGEEIIVVAIDDPSIQRIGPLAWPRSVHAEFLEKLNEAHVVAFDLTFSAEQDPVEDQAFARAIAEHGRVVLASKFYFEEDEFGEKLQVFEPPIPTLMQGAAGLGFVNTPTDPDQVVRRSSLVDVNTFEIPFPSLGLATYMVSENLSPYDIDLSPSLLKLGERQIPIDYQNQALLNFWGPRAAFETVSYADIYEGKFEPAYFKDKIILVGAATAEDHDVYPTPYTTTNMVKTGALKTPGVEIHASLIKTILTDSWFRQVNPWLNFLFLFIVVLLTALAVAGRSPARGALGAVLILALTLAAVYYLWTEHWWLNVAAPIAAILFTYTGVTAWDFIIAEMEKRKTRATFSRYVSADVVDELMENPDEVMLGGKKQVVTIMFADIRGFTAFSENKDPVDVITRLNEYLTAMTDSIQSHGGTLDKYLGDGLMAFFGAPLYYEDHVERAVKVAREIQQKVVELNNKWAEQGAVPLLVAVGINTGPVVVGNVGSPERMDYTLIGEDANLASRVEALTKLFETLVLVSERSYNLLPEGEVKDSLRYVGEELVKGFTQPIKVYSFTDMDLHFEKSEDKGFK